MAVSYRVEAPIVVIAFEGDTSDAEIHAMFERAADDPEVPDRVRLLLDASGSSSLARRSPEAIRGLVEFVAGRTGRFGRRLAVLVGQDVQFGMARMASAFGDPHGLDIQVFREERKARSWLTEPRNHEGVA